MSANYTLFLMKYGQTSHFDSTFVDAAAPILVMYFMGYPLLELEGLYYLNNFHFFNYLRIPTMFLLSN